MPGGQQVCLQRGGPSRQVGCGLRILCAYWYLVWQSDCSYFVAIGHSVLLSGRGGTVTQALYPASLHTAQSSMWQPLPALYAGPEKAGEVLHGHC